MNKASLVLASLRRRGLIRTAGMLSSELAIRYHPLTPARPLFGIIGITDRCNLACRWCPRNDPAIQKGELELAQVRAILDQVPFLQAVTLSGLGEPLLHPELFNMVRYAKSKRMDVWLYTNGTLLTEGVAHRLILSGVDSLAISIDAAEPDLFGSIRRGACFEEVCANVRALILLRNRVKSKLKVTLEAVLMGQNYHQIVGLVKLADELGVDGIGFGDVEYQYDSTLTKQDQIRNLPVSLGVAYAFGELCALAKANELGVTIEGLPRDSQRTVWNPRDGCRYPWHYLAVTSNGDVTPCCAAHKVVLGNVFAQPAMEIWHGAAFTEWRKRMLSSEPPEECLGCSCF